MSKFNEVLKLIDELNLFELNNLIKSLEEKYKFYFNFLETNKNIEKKENINDNKLFSITLSNIGGNKISVIKVIREITSLGLREAKEFVESAPILIKENLNLNEVTNLKNKLEDVGAKVDIK